VAVPLARLFFALTLARLFLATPLARSFFVGIVGFITTVSARLDLLLWHWQGWVCCCSVGKVGFVAAVSARLVSLPRHWQGWFHCHSSDSFAAAWLFVAGCW